MGTRELCLNLDPPLERRELGAYIPLNSMQRRLWSMRNSDAIRNFSRRMCVGSFHVRGNLDSGFVKMSVEALAARHEALRMRFVPLGEAALLHIASSSEHNFSFIDLTHFAGDATAEAKRLSEEFLCEEVGLDSPSMFEARLYKIDCETHLLVIGLPHLFTDGHANMVLIREFWAIYHHYHLGRPLDLPALATQFGDFLCWQHATEAAWIANHARYWQEHFESLAPIEIPVDKTAGSGVAASEMRHFSLGQSVSSGLYQLSREEPPTLQLFLFSVLCIVMSSWCRRTDFAAYFVLHGRHGQPELEHMVGFLANLIPVRVHIAPNDSLAAVVSRLDAEFQSSWSHYDFGRAADFIPKTLSEVGFNWSNRMQKAGDRQIDSSPLVVQPFALDVGWRAKFIVFFYRMKTGIGLTIDYRPDLLERDTVEGFVRKVKLVAAALAERCERPVGDLL